MKSIIDRFKKIKIIPTRDEILSKEASSLAKRICNSQDSSLRMTSKEIGVFNHRFSCEMKSILLDRKMQLEKELEDLTETIKKIK